MKGLSHFQDAVEDPARASRLMPIAADLRLISQGGLRTGVVGIALVVLGAVVLHLWGIGHELPLVQSQDELLFVRPALRIATTGNLDPGWFGHPGSTLIYPLAAICWLARITTAPEAELAGRLLASFYAVLTLPVVYVLALRFVARPAALAATALTAVYPIGIIMSQWTRTDSAATLFGLLALISVLDLLDAPTLRRHALVGVWIGLAIATRYFMVCLFVPYFLAHLWGTRHEPGRLAHHRDAFLGFAIVIATFALTTPFFFLDFTTTLRNLQNEARAVNPGADGLSHFGNFAWYARTVIPGAIGWPMFAMAGASIIVAVARRSVGLVLLASYVVAYFVTVSMSNLHWSYYVIPVLPLLALLAFVSLESATVAMQRSPRRTTAVIVLALVLFGAGPFVTTARHDILAANPTTRLISRDWVLANLPRGSSIAEEWYTAPIDGDGYVIQPTFTLAEHTLEHYRATGVRYLIATNALWNRFYGEPTRYPDQVAFYDELFRQGQLLATFTPSQWTDGPEIRVYELR